LLKKEKDKTKVKPPCFITKQGDFLLKSQKRYAAKSLLHCEKDKTQVNQGKYPNEKRTFFEKTLCKNTKQSNDLQAMYSEKMRYS
jgi:hypothetical protein